MAIVVLGVCCECNDGVQKRLVSRKSSLCPTHYTKKKNEERREKFKEKGYPKGIDPVSDKQKEIDKLDEKFYRQIWNTRKHVSEVGGEALPEKMERWFMSHILCKKLYPHYRHNPENLLLMTKPEHTKWDHGIPHGEKWEKVKLLRDRLREEYNRKEREGEFG
jgi:DNA segregation ATPase FtsK/SpoIIIE-like protein